MTVSGKPGLIGYSYWHRSSCTVIEFMNDNEVIALGTSLKTEGKQLLKCFSAVYLG